MSELRGASASGPAFLRSFLRERLTVVLLVVLPPAIVVGYGEAMGAFPEFVVPDAGRAGRISGALFATAFLAGLVGLFQVISARSADGRLALAGVSRAGLFLARLGTIAAIATVAAAVSFAVLVAGADVAAPGIAFGALVLAGLIYGLVGLLVGSILARELEGSLVLVFLADLDAALSGEIVSVDAAAVQALPMHFPYRVFSEAVQQGTLAAGDAMAAGGYALALLVGAGIVYARTTGEGGLA